MAKRHPILILAACAALIILTRLPSVFAPVTSIDETDFAVQTAVWMNGGTPYIDFVEKKPPIIHMAYAIAFWIGGVSNMAAVHILFMWIIIATAIMIYVSADRIAGRNAAVAAALLFSIYQAGYDLNDFLSANTEILMNLFCTASFLSFIIAAANERRGRLCVALSGFFAAMAVMAKPVAITFPPAIFLACLATRIQSRKFSKVFIDTTALAVGFAIPFIALAIWLHMSGALDDAIRWVWTENARYSSVHVTAMEFLARGATRFGIYTAVSLPLWVLSAVAIARIAKDRNFDPPRAFLLSWLFFSFFSVSLGARFFPHYFLQFLPALAILSSLGWALSAGDIVRRSRTAFAACVAICLIAPAAGFFVYHIYEVGQLPSKYGVERAIASYVASVTRPESRIFVWGHNSDIYFYSRRMPASRFVYCPYLTRAKEGFEDKNALTETSEDAWQMLMDDLSRNPPDAIVDMSGTKIRRYDAFPMTAFPRLNSYTASGYRETKEISGAKIYLKRQK